jgi:DNA processing protein
MGEVAAAQRGPVRPGDDQDEAHRAVYAALPVRKPAPVDDVARRCGLSPGEVRAALGALELSGLARRGDGNGWSKASGRR